VPLNVRWISSAQDSFELHASPEPRRRDLVAHRSVITLRVPPLRDYAEDVPDLLRYYVDRLVDDQHLPLRRFSVAAQNRLRNYPWPQCRRTRESGAARADSRRGRRDPAGVMSANWRSSRSMSRW
jgi:DNA-binding NtrC family response regulator